LEPFQNPFLRESSLPDLAGSSLDYLHLTSEAHPVKQSFSTGTFVTKKNPVKLLGIICAEVVLTVEGNKLTKKLKRLQKSLAKLGKLEPLDNVI
jgi:hypothetical protein